MNSKYAICVYMNDKYLVPYKVFFYSLYMTNPEYRGHDVVILYDELSDTTKDEIKKLHDNVKFMEIVRENYSHINGDKVLYPYLVCTFHKLDVFRVEGYDKVLLIDVDMLVYKKFEPDLFSFDGEMMMCDDGIKGMYNSGLIVIDKKHINEDTYKGVLERIKGNPRLPDQVIINDHFRHVIKRLPHRFNVTAPILKIIKRESIVLFHYAGVKKPWSDQINNRFFFDWLLIARRLGIK